MNVLKTELKATDMGELSWVLRIQITSTDNGITLSQTNFIDKIRNCFSMQDWKPVSTPVYSKHQLKANENKDEHTDAMAYQQSIRCLMYLVTGTRPDLLYTITQISQFNSSPSTKQLTASK